MASPTTVRQRGNGSLPRGGGLVDLSQPSAEPFRTIRLALELRPETRRGNVIVFTSPEQGEGKSTIAANYALVAALGQQSVLLVDADLRHPTLHDTFRVPRAPGLVEVLGRRVELADGVHRVRSLGRVDLLTAGTPIPGVADLMSSSRMHDIFQTAAETYDVIVMDSPPVLAVADASSLAARPDVDVVLIVNRNGRRRPLMRALRKLELVGANVLGLIVNREGSLSTYGY